MTAGGYLRADATSHNVTAVRRMMRDSRRTLEDVAARQSELAPLQSSKMLANLADWANRVMTGGAVYSAEGLILRMVSPGHPEAAVDLGGLPSGSDSHFQHVAALWPSL